MLDVNPWLLRFAGLDDPDELRSRATIRGTPLRDLESVPEYRIQSTVQAALSNFYLPTTADVDILKKIVQSCQAHCHSHYSERQQYFKKEYTQYQTLPIELSKTICLTGPAGTGKTALLRALRRLLPAPVRIALGAEHADVVAESSWHIEVRDRSSVSTLLKPFIATQLGDARKDSAIQLRQMCAKIAHKKGVALLVLDELQCLTQSANANTLVTKTLYQFTYIGIPFLFVGNYSLCRLLLKRPEQDRQRFLSMPIVLLPSTPESPDWLDYLLELKHILGASLQVDLHEERYSIHRLTAGLKRLVIQLLAIAYRNAWHLGRTCVTPADINDAYDSTEYSVSRDQASAMLSPSSDGASKTYECPFPLPKIVAAATVQMANRARERMLVQKVQREALTRQERECLARKEKKEGTTRVAEPTANPPRPRRGKLTSAELLQTHSHRKGGIYPK